MNVRLLAVAKELTRRKRECQLFTVGGPRGADGAASGREVGARSAKGVGSAEFQNAAVEHGWTRVAVGAVEGQRARSD